MSEREVRAITTELRFDEGDSALVGYAAMYNVWSQPLGGFRERIAPGSFDRAIAEGQDVRALWNHDTNYVLGRTKSETLRLTSDEVGLRVVISPPDTEWASGLVESVKRGDIDQMSFGFEKVTDKWWSEEGEANALRELQDVNLFDVSPVTFPAYPQTQLTAREHKLMGVVRKAAHDLELSPEEREALAGLIAKAEDSDTVDAVEPDSKEAYLDHAVRAIVSQADRRYDQLRSRYGL